MRTLLLNACSVPVDIIPWQQAVLLMLDGRVNLVASYPDRRVRSASTSIEWPAVVRDVARDFSSGLPPIRQNVFARDRHRCLYCDLRPKTPSGRPDLSLLTLDHVIPRCRSEYGYVEAADGMLIPVSGWENLVTACGPCNRRKDNRMPTEANMIPIEHPTAPGFFTRIRIVVSRVRYVPVPWEPYLEF